MNEGVATGGSTGETGAASATGNTDVQPRFAIVIPMLNEAGAIPTLLDECRAAAASVAPYEICVTDDGSTDATLEALTAWGRAHPESRLTIIRHPRSAGQSAAIHSAVRAVRAPIVCTLDGDGQNPPDQIPLLLAPLLSADREERLGVVAGQRVKRDDPAAKRLASKAANAIRRFLLKDGTPDTGCGLKAFRRDAFLALPYFNHMHRFLPALFQRDGWNVAHVPVTHRSRSAGRSKYNNLGRAIHGAVDLLGVAWLIGRRRKVAAHEAEAIRPEREPS